MKTLIKLFAMALFSVASVTMASDFPEGSPKFSTNFNTTLKEAKKNGKPIVVVFSAIWCPPCQEMKKAVYPSEPVKAYHDQFNWAYVDVDESSNEKVVTKFEAGNILPTVLFLDAQGELIKKSEGFSDAKDFAKLLKGVIKKTTK